MKTIIRHSLLLITLATALVACKTAHTTTATALEVPFKEARNYFVSNTVEDFRPRVIRSQKEFDKFFGAAAVMGKDGEPTPIDFSRQYVIAVLRPSTDKPEMLRALKLTPEAHGLTLHYELRRAHTSESWSMTPCLLLIVNNQYKGEVKFLQYTRHQ